MSQGLFIGIAKRNITPPVGGYLYGYPNPPRSTSVNDDLTVTALYLEEGDTRALLLSFTICSLAATLCDRLSVILEEDTGISRTAILLHATHTHSGPSTTDSVGWGKADSDYIETVLIPAARAAAKKERNFAEADRIRNLLTERGITLIDTKEGTTWKRA